MADFRKSLEDVRDEWRECQKCELGVRRAKVGGEFVFGEGTARRGVMFIGEGPGAREEKEGRPFCGPSGDLLRTTLEQIGLEDYYITNIVSCRSCARAFDGEGNPRNRYDYSTGKSVPDIRDEPPTPIQCATCMPRLHEEIYLVDPLFIVTLGGGAAKALTGKPITITMESGNEREVQIPGAGNTPKLTEKRRIWVRKVRGQVVAPTQQNMVRYLLIPLMHPAYVLRYQNDARLGRPLPKFAEDMKKVVDVYRRLSVEIHGTPPGETEERE